MKMTAQERIEEAHGIWELEIQRLFAFVECQAPVTLVMQALASTRQAYDHWKQVSKDALKYPA